MKKLWILLLTCMIFLLTGCGDQGEETQASQQPQDNTTTVMIYMMGSDLEAKTGAGTQDLDEIVSSGTDLSKINVLVYAGGAPKWQNDLASPEKHTVLKLTENGFEKLTDLQAFSMGESQCLSNFLKYGHSNFPASQYALILWNHGNGPVIGYGKDMLFDNDSLTLTEMQAAMADSPFGQDNKLKWVGFDACLMASVELACVWAPYAEYLVASQEVEPSFGWNYDFMDSVSDPDTAQVLADLAQGYMAACLAYFEERGYEDREATLSCVDLRYASELEDTVNQLFARATADVGQQYNQLTARRAKTRALGRASTGSEYDLIDLYDMGMWLGQLYPEEVTAMQQVLDQMVVTNVTNTDNLCGMSMYYPFYNKRHYEKDWANAYQELGVLPEYQSYLKQYEQIWLKNDKLTVASSRMPSQLSQETYTLQLTPEQAESYATGRYYVMERLGDELYTIMFASSNITEENGLLTANFDGNIIYVKDDYGQYAIPVSVEHDTVGDKTRFSVYVGMDNDISIISTAPEDYVKQSGNFRYQLAVDNTTKEIAISGLLPADAEVTTEGLLGGKLEDVDLSQWVHATFPHQRHRYLTRYDNGAISPVADWPVSGILTGNQFIVADGLEFVYAPLVTGDYCILFEVEDTQGNRYCSDLLPISVSGSLPQAEEPEPVELTWDQGDRLILCEQENVTVFMEQWEAYEGTTYTLGVDNRSDRAVLVQMENPFLNETVDATSMGSLIYFEALPGQTTIDETGITDWGDLGSLQVIDELYSLTFQLSIRDSLTRKTLLQPRWYHVEIGEQYRLEQLITWFNIFWEIDKPSRGLFAQEQVLFEDETYRLTLLNMGAYQESDPEESDICVGLKIENLSDHMIYPNIQGLVLDGIFREAIGGPRYVHPGCTAYFAARVDSKDLNHASLTDIQEAKVVMRFDANYTILGLGGFAQIRQYPVTLSQAGAGSRLPASQELIFDEFGVRIWMLNYAKDEWSDEWYVLVENDSDYDICLDVNKCTINGEEVSANDFTMPALYEGMMAAHQKTVSRFSLIHFGEVQLEEMSFQLLIQDFTQQKVLFTGETRIELVVPENP